MLAYLISIRHQQVAIKTNLALNATNAASNQVDITATFTVASKTGTPYIRAWIVGWAGTWS